MATARSRWRTLERELTDAPELLLLSTSTVDTLIPHLGLALVDRGQPRRVRAGEYGVLHPELLAAAEAGDQRPADIVVLAEFEGLFGHAPSAEQSARDVERLVDALTRAAAAGSHVWVSLPVPPRPPEAADALPGGRLRILRTAEQALLEAADRTATLHVIDLPGRLSRHGDAAYDDRLWYFARQRFATAVLPDAADVVAEAIASSRRPPYKALAVDCDGVLWGGVLGEDGPDGIRIGDEDAVGRAFRAVQEHLVRLAGRGVLIALCSKNDERDVWDVVDHHPGMALRREHISAAAIGWEPKSSGLERIAAQLNILPSAIVFLDDNPAEVAEAAANQPETLSVLSPADPVELVPFLAAQDWFLTTQVTAEDLSRTEMMAAERARTQHAEHVDAADYLADLGLRVALDEVTDQTFARVHQLIHKTNQFNVTVRRHDEAELRELLERPGWFGLTVTVDDRFGGYGLTGVAIAGPQDDALLVDTFLLSCRVLGRNVEDLLLAELQQRAQRLGLGAVRFALTRTERNAPAQAFLARRELATEDEVHYEQAVDGEPWWPPHITIARTEVRA
jgi:FkbH-like protein